MEWENSMLASLKWSKAISNREEKEKVAVVIASMVKNEEIIGVGSGSTSYVALLSIARKVKEEKLNIQVIPTSQEIRMACAQLELPVTTLWEHRPDWSFDGADEIDPHHNMIKGRGGAMFREKLLINSTSRTYIIADTSKMVPKLGDRFPVPVEVFPESLTYVDRVLRNYHPKDIVLRMAEGKDGPVITENGNFILDVWFESIADDLEHAIKSITGVIESGLFMHYKVEILNPMNL